MTLFYHLLIFVQSYHVSKLTIVHVSCVLVAECRESFIIELNLDNEIQMSFQ